MKNEGLRKACLGDSGGDFNIYMQICLTLRSRS